MLRVAIWHPFCRFEPKSKNNSEIKYIVFQFFLQNWQEIIKKITPKFWCFFSGLSILWTKSARKSVQILQPGMKQANWMPNVFVNYLIIQIRVKRKGLRLRIFCLCWSISDRAACTRVGFFCFMPRTQRAKTPWRDGGLCWQDWKSSVLAGSAPWKNNYYIFLPTV